MEKTIIQLEKINSADEAEVNSLDEALDEFLQQLDDDPELQAIKARLSHLEAQIRSIASEEVWKYLLEWEEEWAHYVTICIRRLHARANASGASSSRPD